ncbi:chromosome segregation protein [bacterium BMS3Abin11]|nr:chromosome segregation protein [bacterium BMS3Abin11]
MTERIKKLSIQGFRGATQPLDLSFDTKKPVILIFGENGSGKSTIVDALECVGSGSTAFVDDWKLGKGKRKESYIPTLGKNINDVKISLEFGEKEYKASLNARGVKLCNTPGRPHTKVLRRKSLQAFIDADPAQRYKEVASFLDIPQIEASELTLRQAYKQAKDSFDSATRASVQAQETLHGLWEAEGSPGHAKEFKNAEAWARPQTESDVETLQQELAKLKAGIKHTDNLTKNYQAYQQASDELKQANEKLKLVKENLAEIEAAETKSNAQLVTLLEDAKDYLQASPDKVCPVCEQTEIEAEQLVQRLAQRIDGMDQLKQANAAIKQATTNQQTKTELLQRAEKNMLNTAQSSQLHFVKELTDEQSIKYLVEQKKEEAKEQALALASALNDELSSQRDDLQIFLDKLQKQIHTLNSIKQLIATLDEKANEAQQAETVQKKLGLAVEIFESKRKAYVETVLLEIATSVDELYQKIHPQEDLGHLKLKLDDRQRGSLVYGVAFKDQQDIHPQPYYSESHLDTLGLCIFLALAKRGNTDKTIVILDDVLGSVDQLHLARTLDMLLGESDSFAQIIMTTHYRPLRDRFRYAHNPTAPVQLIELKPWNFEQGIRSGKTKLYVDELRQQLKEDDFRRDVVASQAGQLFENLLEFISRAYRCKVPHTIEPRFTFGELSSAPNKELKKNLKIVSQIGDDETIETEILPIYEKLNSAIYVRNLVGCHFNQWAGELSDQDIREMAELSLELADAFICIHCGSLPVSNKSGSYWECHCKKTQMHPLQQPKK